jgi:arsenate reductase (thioredoxin)
MKKILFICLGNVARSQMAEAFYNKLTKDGVATSAGNLDYTPEKYGHPLPEVITVMNEEGIDLGDKNVKTVTEDMYKDADHVYILCKREECRDFLLHDENKVTFWKIEDPFGSSLDTYRIIRAQIKNLVQSIVQIP